MLNTKDIFETIRMIDDENLDIRTITMGISLLDCADSDIHRSCDKIYEKITRCAARLVPVGEELEKMYGIPIINKRIAVTPIAMLTAVSGGNPVLYAQTLERAARAVGVNFIGGYSALVQKGFSAGDKALIESIPEALATTQHICSSVNIGSTKAGINMDAVKMMGQVIKRCAEITKDDNCIGAAKLVVFCNAPEDNPFMAGAFHGVGEPDCVLNVGVSGPGVVRAALAKCPTEDLSTVADVIKKTAFKITRMGQLIGTEASKRLGVPFGIIDLSLAPTPAVGDSVAHIIEEIGVGICGGHGTTAALAMLNDAVKKGGVMASSHVGGLSGAFIPVSEDAGMIAAAENGTLSIEKLEAMTSVCSVGLDMIVVPGDTSAATLSAIIADEAAIGMVVVPGDTTAATLSAIIADEAAIGMVNSKTTAVRLIPAIGKQAGEVLEFGGLLGTGPIMPLRNDVSSEKFINRGGRIPAPMQSLKN